jgi:outer membrane protein assembly factor BamB
MRRAIALTFMLVLAGAGALYLYGVRVELDGGTWPRFVSTVPDYDALEADRARQKEAPLPVAETSPTATPAPPVAPAAGEGAAGALPDGHAAAPTATPGSWTDFRGRRRDGRYDEPPVLLDWPRGGPRLMWKQPIGLGYASFVAAEGRAFTIEQRRAQEVVAAYDVATGRELWTNGWAGEFRESMGGDGPRATPTYHDGRVYALGALGELRSLDAKTGSVIWRRQILEENGAANLEWGMSGSPLIVDDLVVVQPGGPGGRSVVAYKRRTGEPVWRALNDRQAYVSPMLVTLAGVRQLLIVSASRVMGLTVDAGRVLWEYPWQNDTGINVAQPLLLGGDRVFLSSSYGGGAAVIEVTRDGDSFVTKLIWSNQRMKNKFTSSVLRDGFVYGLDESILACIDAATGDVKWKAGRYGYGQVMLAGDRLIVLTEDGQIVQVRATPERHEELVAFDAISGKTWNHPAIVDGRLLVRNGSEMAAFDLRH